MNIRRGMLIGSFSMLVCSCLLFAAYPWSIYYGNFDFGWKITLGSYIVLAVLVGLIEAILTCALSLYKQMPPIGQCILTGMLSSAFLFAGSILLGPGGVNLFDMRIRGIFFAEWDFAKFDFEVALPLSAMNAGLVWCAVRWGNRWPWNGIERRPLHP
jgi:hypothetical protein